MDRIGHAGGTLFCGSSLLSHLRQTFRNAAPSDEDCRLYELPGYAGKPAFSPEGNSIAFVWNGDHGDNFDVYVKLVDAGSPRRLTNDPAVESDPAWSPDSRLLLFSRSVHDGSSFCIIPSLVEAKRKIADVKSSGQGIDWSPDGKTLVVSASESAEEPNCIC